MKITDVVLETFSWPLLRSISNAAITLSRGGMTLVKIKTDADVTGIGNGYAKPVIRTAIEQFRPLLIGEDPLNVERIWQKMYSPKAVGRRGLTTQAISAIDIALWDLRAKLAGMPAYKMLGGFTDRVPVYIAGGYYAAGKGIKELQKEMESYVTRGAKAIKMKVGGMAIAEDVARVRSVREVIGSETKLMVDANCGYRAYEAIQFARQIEQYDIFWFEEPVGADDYEGMRRVAEMTPIPIAAGENEYTKYGFRDLIACKGVSIITPDAKICGGITEFMKIAALTQAYDLAVSPHGSQEVHTHLAAAIPNAILIEYFPQEFDAMWGKRYEHTIVLNPDGTVSPPDLPGFGAEPCYQHLDQYRVT